MNIEQKDHKNYISFHELKSDIDLTALDSFNEYLNLNILNGNSKKRAAFEMNRASKRGKQGVLKENVNALAKYKGNEFTSFLNFQMNCIVHEKADKEHKSIKFDQKFMVPSNHQILILQAFKMVSLNLDYMNSVKNELKMYSQKKLKLVALSDEEPHISKTQQIPFKKQNENWSLLGCISSKNQMNSLKFRPVQASSMDFFNQDFFLLDSLNNKLIKH